MQPAESLSVKEFSLTLTSICTSSLESTLLAICGSHPLILPSEEGITPCNAMVGVISWSGQVKWSFSLVIPKPTAIALAETFGGYPIPFDSAEMGDMVGELANIVAGEIAARLKTLGIYTDFSLPMVTRGLDVEVLARVGDSLHRIDVECPQGRLWFKVAAVERGHFIARKPGT